jgi:hypothetical protein
MANTSGITRGEWKTGYDNYGNGSFAEWHTILVGEDEREIAKVGKGRDLTPEDDANADFICLCANQCQSINPDHPEYVAEKIGRMAEVLKEAKLELEYLRDKFQKTGTGEATLARIHVVLADMERGDK